MAISAGTQVQTGTGRTGVCVYDNASVTDNTHPSAYVIFNDSTYAQFPRGTLTSVSGGFLPGTGPGN